MKTTNVAALLLASTLSFALPFAATSPVEAKDTAKTAVVGFPRQAPAPLALGCGPVRVRSVRIDDPPKAADLEKGRNDPDDSTRLRWLFSVGNGGRKRWETKIHVTVYDSDDRVLADDSRSDTIRPRTPSDHISVWTKIRTADYTRADHVRVTIGCDRD